MTLLIQLLLAHFIGDFFLQPDAWIRNKEQQKIRSKFLYLHVAIHFFLLLIITGNFLFWETENIPWKQILLITVLHLIIDGVKVQFQLAATKRIWFFIDQVLHIASILIVWSFAEKMKIDWEALSNKKILIPVTAIVFILKPTSYIIRNIISQWTPDGNNNTVAGQVVQQGGALPSATSNPFTPSPAIESLKNAGQLIGILERLLVFTFILMGKWEGVGFLLAAKSVFRFGDLKDSKEMKLTEYVLIGTLLSFGIAMGIGLITVRLLE